MPEQRVLITGINGFIAGHLAERLLYQGANVRGTTRRPQSAEWLRRQGAELLQADLMDRAALTAAADGCNAIVHAAAWTGGAEIAPETGYRVNVDGTANVLAAAEQAGVQRFMYISSIAVYGRNRAPLIDETAATPRVGQAYPDSKIVAEALVRECGLPYVIIRPASTYGPRGKAWTLEPVNKIKSGQLVLLGKDRGLVTPGYIDNVVHGLLLALTRQKALGEAFNVADERAVTYREFYLAYARMLGLTSLPTVPAMVAQLARFGPAQTARQMLGRPSAGPWSLHFRFNPSGFSVAKAKRLLGYQPRVSFEEGMRRTETWLRENGYIT